MRTIAAGAQNSFMYLFLLFIYKNYNAKVASRLQILFLAYENYNKRVLAISIPVANMLAANILTANMPAADMLVANVLAADLLVASE